MTGSYPDEHEGGAVTSSDAAREANGIAFLLASAAYLALAGAIMRREGAAALDLMDEIEVQIDEAMISFVAENTEEVARPDILLHATRKVRALLDAGRLMAPEMQSLQ
ncbi:hypothetical protein [Methylobacterium longum]|uniref:Uncharacterized protein n=1 Tax=Methylobacterium longum TaxID=767694 RepID=A0ABT8AYH7_9HYPH|nr:hypothetical protein [Methylobacterium longum]MDN3574662.1 hypothetical protein [Methylobacterium longum]GJE13650.1 hypothetical protein FOHLNKBM_4714 [Methylobacterium longum]